MTRIIRWEEPSNHERRGRKPGRSTVEDTRWAETLSELKERPGDWALIAENDWLSPPRIALLKNGCEVVSRGFGKPANGMAEKIYARYVGQEA